MCVCGDTGSGWVGGGSDIKFFAKAMETMCSPGTIASPRVLGCLKCPRGLDSISAGSQNRMNTIQVYRHKTKGVYGLHGTSGEQ